MFGSVSKQCTSGESHFNSDHDVTHMEQLSIGDEIRAEVRETSGGYVAVIRGSELLIRNDDNITTGDSVTARLVGSNSVVIPGKYDHNKKSLPGELFAIVDIYNHHSPSIVRCIEPPFVGELFLVEELESSSNIIIPILPLDAKAEQRAAITTNPSLWPGERVGERDEYSYSDELAECFKRSETVSSDKVEKLKGLIAKTRVAIEGELRITKTDFIAQEALEYTSRDADSSPDVNAEDDDQHRFEGQSSVRTNSGGDTKTQETPSGSGDQELQLSDDEATYTTTRRRQRGSDFTRRIKSIYNEKCAICRKRRVTPDGNPEVEAAHIYPKSEGGVDHVKNGLALCKLHHWAFDSGWMCLTEDYRIVVADYQEYDGYEDLERFDSKKILLPEKDEHKPHEKFISEHQKIHEFER